MGVSADGQICYGLAFEEGFEFPWDAEKFDGDHEDWWAEVKGYVNPNFDPYDDDGNYKPGLAENDPRIPIWHAHSHGWIKENPFPLDVVNYCSSEVPMYILAVKSSSLSNSRGYPTVFDPAALVVSAEERDALLGFCREYGIEIPGEPQWLLSSYWG